MSAWCQQHFVVATNTNTCIYSQGSSTLFSAE